jgi:hypothetical protein
MFFKNLEEVGLRSLMRRDVNLGIDCIFDVLISAMFRSWIEGSVHQVLIHTYDAVLLFGCAVLKNKAWLR